jgi:hypothetical protein
MTPPPTSTAAERRARAQNFLEGLGSRAVHRAADRAFRLDGTLLDAGHDRVAGYVRAGAEAAQRGDKAEADKQFHQASELARKEGLEGARAKINAIDAEYRVVE